MLDCPCPALKSARWWKSWWYQSLSVSLHSHPFLSVSASHPASQPVSVPHCDHLVLVKQGLAPHFLPSQLSTNKAVSWDFKLPAPGGVVSQENAVWDAQGVQKIPKD